MAKKNKNVEKLLIVQIITENIAKIFCSLFKWGFGALIVWQLSLGVVASANALAGKVTITDISLKGDLNANINSNNDINDAQNDCSSYLIAILLASIFGVGGLIYGQQQRRLRMDLIERYHTKRVHQEKEVDQGRTSSDLMPRGNTRPEDL